MSISTFLKGQEGYKFHDVSEGLSQNTVTCIQQDKQGFLWIGTQYGLNKFDGHQFQYFVHQSGKENSLSKNQITEIVYQENKDVLWIGTYGGGVDCYDIQADSFYHFNIANKYLTDNYITDLHIDTDAMLWIATEKGGLNAIDTKTNKKLIQSSAFHFDQINSKYITAVNGQKDLLLCGTWNDGLQIANLNKGTVSAFDLNKAPIRTILQKNESEYIIGTNKGIVGIRMENGKAIFDYDLFPAANNSVILTLTLDQQNNLFIGTENNGLFVLDKKGNYTKYTYDANQANQISGNSIWAIFEDANNILWLGFYLKGLNKIDANEHKFNSIQNFLTNENEYIELDLVSSLSSSSQDELLWIGTDGSGLYSYHRPSGKYHSHDIWSKESKKVVTSLEVDNQDKLWVGTWQEGIKLYDLKSKTVENINTKLAADRKVSSDFIHSILKDQEGNMWVAAFGAGVDIFSNNKLKKSFTKPDLISLKITVIIEGCNNEIFIGTEESGVQKIKIDEQYNITHSEIYLNKKESESENHNIIDMLVDTECNTWVATPDGLIKISVNTEKVEYYTTTDGLPSNMISSIEIDSEGVIWVSSNKGIFSFDPNSDNTQIYTTSDGLTSTEFSRESSLKTKSGEIYFGNTTGVNHFNPNQLIYNTIIPSVFITDVRISDRPISKIFKRPRSELLKEDALKLKYNQNDISFEFTALNFTQSDQNQFQFRLLGLEDEWQKITNTRTIAYRNLAPDNYVFEVRGSNNDNTWNLIPARFEFKVARAWYNSILAWICYVVLFFSLLFFGIRNVLSRERLQSELAIEQMEIKKLKEVDKLKSKFFANISHEFMTPLTMIISPILGYLDSPKEPVGQDMATTILRNAERLKKYISQILALSKLEAGATNLIVSKNNFSEFVTKMFDNFTLLANEKNIQFRLNTPSEEIFLHYDPEKMEEILSNLFSNAIKYSTQNDKVEVRITELQETIQLEVEDTGQGIAPEHIGLVFDRFFREQNENVIKGTGIGLSITKQLVELHKGEISVSSELNIGSNFKLILKKGKSHFDPKQIQSVDSPLFSDINSNTTDQKQKDGNTLQVNLQTNNQPTINPNLPIILVVEDNKDIRSYLRHLLSNQYNVLLAKDGQIGFELAQKQIPDVIISDVMMPHLNGYELCEKLKNNELTSHIAIIMLTVKSSEDSLLKGYGQGADYYLTKPFNPELLKLRIKNILNFRNSQLKLMTLSLEQKQIGNESKLSSKEFDFLAKVDGIILENIGNSAFGVLDLTSQLGFSKSQLYRKLKAIINLSSNEYIRNFRLNKAAELLLQDEFNISEVTYKVGFNDLQYFRKCFKKLYGVTPSAYVSKFKKIKSM